MAQTGTEKKKSIKVYVTRLTEWRTFWPYYLQWPCTFVIFIEKLLVTRCWVISLSSPGIKNLSWIYLSLHMVFITLSKKRSYASFCSLITVNITKMFPKWFYAHKDCRQQFAQCYCIKTYCAVRMRNLVCLMLELLFFYLLCVIMFEPDCILIGSCACGCPNKAEFSRDSHTKSLWGTPAMTKQKVQNESATTKYLLDVRSVTNICIRYICNGYHSESCKPVTPVRCVSYYSNII
jgi:hypothetical protein